MNGKEGDRMFLITQGSGFQLTLGNGWTASVQFGQANYCSTKVRHNDPSPDWNAPHKTDFWESRTAEIAAWYGEREGINTSNWYNFGNDDQVQGWCTADEVVAFLGMVAALPSRKLRVADYEASDRHDVPVAPV